MDAVRSPRAARAALACQLAAAHADLFSVSMEAPLAEFATPEELRAFRAGLERARHAVTAAECVLHDLTFRVAA